MSSTSSVSSVMDQEQLNPGSSSHINVAKQLFPYCVVWTPLPLISWVFPPIGHMGIASSSGVTYDFGAPYYVSEGKMTFGRVTRYMQLNRKGEVPASNWDRAVENASEDYRKKMHNICIQNCHHHTAHALNLMGYDGGRWGQFRLGLDLFLFGSFTNFSGFLRTWLPFIVMMLIIVAFTVGFHV